MKYKLTQCSICHVHFDINVSGTKTTFPATCKCGTIHDIILDGHLYEVLFDSGCLAIHDGYYRSAIFDFEASFERFREYLIKEHLRKKGIDKEGMEIFWKSIASSSESQNGAYNLILTTEKIMLPDEKIINNRKTLRNKYIHNGYIPSKLEAIEYMNIVLETMKIVHKTITPTVFLEKYINNLFYKKSDNDLNLNENHPKIILRPISFEYLCENDYSFENEDLIKRVVHIWRGIESLLVIKKHNTFSFNPVLFRGQSE